MTTTLSRAVDRVDARLIPFLRRAAIPTLRVSLGLVFVWFGALKLADESPVADLVAHTVYWVDPDLFVKALGVFEVFVGVMLLFGWALRLTLAVHAVMIDYAFLITRRRSGQRPCSAWRRVRGQEPCPVRRRQWG
jgi:uncharacterized membrane protein YphA (DoxX/SURF4 family)